MGELTKEVWIDAPPEEVYRYLVEPELTTTWFGDESWNEPRTGGLYRISVLGNVVSGAFVELDPGRRVVHTWGWEGPDQLHEPGTTTVEWDLEAVDGGTRVRLRHSGLTEKGVEAHSEGWDRFVPELAKAAQGHALSLQLHVRPRGAWAAARGCMPVVHVDRRRHAVEQMLGEERGWRFAPLYSSARSSFNPGLQRRVGRGGPTAGRSGVHARRRRDDHRWSSELMSAPRDESQHPRHVDYMWPIWKVLDVIPEGRGSDWHPRFLY